MADPEFIVSNGSFIADVTRIVGEENCLTDPAAQVPYLSDFRGLYHGRAAAVVKPSDTVQVAEVVTLCGRRGRPIVPRGGNTGLCGGTAPSAQEDGIILSLERMNRVRSHDLVNNTITVEAGCILQVLQGKATALKRHFPLSLGAEGSCQIGGNIATNAGGTAVLRYGNMRELVLGLEVVLPSGQILSDLRGLRKNNTGYDLKQLFVGSEGTLGIITAATLKLFPERRQTESALVAVADLNAVLTLYADVRDQADEFLTAFELLPRNGIEMALAYVPGLEDPLEQQSSWYVLIELSSSQTAVPLRPVIEDILASNFAAERVLDGTIAVSTREAQMFWRIREACVEAQRLAGPSFKHDVSMPLNMIPRFIESATAEIGRRFPAVEVVAFGHVGDGNIHFNICCGREQSPDDFFELAKPVETIVYDQVAAVGGSFSAEHGVGLLKRDALIRYGAADAVEMMACIKRLLDPGNILNPGKVLALGSGGSKIDERSCA
ncbi:FAD-binding oxidoreductase [Rhodoligotrophos defluvii]|uniref:FAD-binding oxidoreductase n=1 Tax=Rhodoligotrophos defluvii TaxID=2561934 RepID=UPI0010CA17F0|nr:FAD-binding oxidoreductase [Rhodoligotrophos defluvii]